MNKEETNNTKWIGNYFGFTGKSYDGWVIDKKHISFPILASCANGSVPKIIVKINKAE